jgi:hypothetical protein
MKVACCLLLGLFPTTIFAQQKTNADRWFSLGLRGTSSNFSDDGSGAGIGGQFRIGLSDRVNTDWFADYIVTNPEAGIRSTFYHIGWSVLYYPIDPSRNPRALFQPFILAGHCFDYNEKKVLSTGKSRGRWGSAVQAGLGTHIRLSSRFDISLLSQYMLHLTRELEVVPFERSYLFVPKEGNALEGHLLSTISLNYKIARLWQHRATRPEEQSPIHKGLIRTTLTLSPGYFTALKESYFYIHGNMEYYLSPTWSVAGDGYIGMGRPLSNAAFREYHNIFFGANWHHARGRNDLSLGLQPGAGFVQTGSPGSKSTAMVALASATAGYNFFINRNFHFFLQGRYSTGSYEDNGRHSLSELRLSAGLGLQFSTLKTK